MQKLTIKILKADDSFRDTIVGKEYEAFAYEAGEFVPEPWSRPWDRSPERFKVIALIDEEGDDILQGYDEAEGEYFSVSTANV